MWGGVSGFCMAVRISESPLGRSSHMPSTLSSHSEEPGNQGSNWSKLQVREGGVSSTGDVRGFLSPPFIWNSRISSPQLDSTSSDSNRK